MQVKDLMIHINPSGIRPETQDTNLLLICDFIAWALH
jgi:hypothetical protein